MSSQVKPYNWSPSIQFAWWMFLFFSSSFQIYYNVGLVGPPKLLPGPSSVGYSTQNMLAINIGYFRETTPSFQWMGCGFQLQLDFSCRVWYRTVDQSFKKFPRSRSMYLRNTFDQCKRYMLATFECISKLGMPHLRCKLMGLVRV